MAGWVAVLVDSKELVRFAKLREGESGVLNLTTMLPDQDRVHVEIYLVNGASTECIHTFRAAGVRRGQPRPQIVVSAHLRGALNVSLRIDGELIATTSVTPPERMTAFRLRPLLVLLLAVALAGAAGYGVWRLVAGASPGEAAIGRPAGTGRLPDYRPPGPSGDSARSDGPSPDPSATDEAGEDPADETADDTAGATAPELVEPELPDPASPVYFDPDRATLTAGARREIERFATSLAGWSASGGDMASVVILLEGHTALYGNEPGRLALSRDRATAVEEHLAESLRDLGLGGFTTRVMGVGANEPVTRAEDQQWRNRRVEISFASEER